MLESAFRDLPGAMDHPGLLHLHVHLMEMSPHPEAALVTGDRLREVSPDMGHLVAHADPHRHPMRPLPRRDALEPEGDHRGPQVLRPRRADEFLFRLPHPQLPLRRLWRDVPRPVRARHRRRRRADRDHARGVPAHSLAAHGGFLRGLRFHPAARAGPLRQMARDHRAGSAGGSRALLQHRGDDALRQGRRARRAGRRAGGGGRTGAVPRGRAARARSRGTSTT